MTSKLNVLTDQCRAAVCEVRPPQLAASLVDQFLSTTRAPCLSVILASGHRRHAARGCPRNDEIGDGGDVVENRIAIIGPSVHAVGERHDASPKEGRWRVFLA
jgi:hypothetical protein